MKTLINLASLAVRHAFAVGVVVMVGLVCWTVVYFGLLLWAIVTGSGLGSPLVYPLGLLAILCGGTVASLLMFLPATLAAEVVCRWCAWPVLVGIPCSFGVYGLLALVWGMVARFSGGAGLLEVAAGLVILGAIPLGLYWWAAMFPAILRDVAGKMVRMWRIRKGA